MTVRKGSAPAVTTRALWWAQWPRLDYGSALALQHRLHGARDRGEIPDALVVTEHPRTVTLGRRGALADLRIPPTELAARGIAFYQTGRGGRATFHGPGQLVVYPIMDLHALRLGPRRFVEALECALVGVLRQHGIIARRGASMPGVWVEERKIGAVGIEIRAGITRHGVSLNLDVELAPFDLIVPCGETAGHLTSIRALGIPPPAPVEVAAGFAAEVGALLDLHPRKVEPAMLDRRGVPRRPAAPVRLGGGERTWENDVNRKCGEEG